MEHSKERYQYLALEKSKSWKKIAFVSLIKTDTLHCVILRGQFKVIIHSLDNFFLIC